MKAPAPVWPVRELLDIATISSGGTPSKGRAEYWNSGNVPWITARDMKSLRIGQTASMLTSEGAKAARVMPPGTVFILTRGMTLFRDLPVVLNIQESSFNQDVKALTPSAEMDPEFLALSIIDRKADLLQHVSTAGHGTGRLDTQRLESFPVPVPPLPEQRKIAEILRTWDDAIDAHEGLRSRAIRVNSSIAAASFAPVHYDSRDLNAGWNEWKLGDLFAERNEAGDPSLPLLSVTQGNGVVTQESTGRRNSANADRSKYKLVLPGDVAYNTMRMWQGASGVAQTTGVVSPAYTVVVPDVARVSPQFSAHLFKSPRMMFDFERYSQGLTSDTWNLKYPAFSRIRVNFPSIERQRRIADALDQVKQLESLHASAAELLRAQKRGLMQKLLTGHVRVNVAADVEPGGDDDD